MKIAVFSDVHGNLRALKSALEMINDNKADEIIYLGDIFQRGNEEVECLELLKESGVVCLKGNCELYAANGVDIDPDVEYLREYYDGIKSKLSDEQMNFVKEMPLFCEKEYAGHKFFFSHFLFFDISEPYPYLPLSSLKTGAFDEACKSEDIKKYDLVVVGHCHRNFVKGNVVAVSATGLENPSFLLIEVNEEELHFEHINII